MKLVLDMRNECNFGMESREIASKGMSWVEKVTWIPAREEREMGLFLSLSLLLLSLSLFAAVVFAARSPFPPFPAIPPNYL